jgi:hypothetical protein
MAAPTIVQTVCFMKVVSSDMSQLATQVTDGRLLALILID